MSTLTEKLKAHSTAVDPPHIIVRALAGTGKSTTLLQGVMAMVGMPTTIVPSPQQAAVWESLKASSDAKSIHMIAFSKALATNLQSKLRELQLPSHVTASTTHSMGYAAVRQAYGNVRLEESKVAYIISDLTGKDLKELRQKDFTLLVATENLVGLCKQNLVDGYDSQALARLAAHYDVDLNGSQERVFDLVPEVLKKCAEVHDKRIDFNDMIWLPVVNNLPVPKYDVLMVDESQDLNRCQQQLALKAGKRLVLVGDVNQAIFGFAGADAESMERMDAELSATEAGCISLPLTVTYRCGRSIVEEAREIVPDYEAHESNCEGSISRAAYKDVDPSKIYGRGGSGADAAAAIASAPQSYHETVQDGDMLLCRVNAPLVNQCFRFIKMGRKAEIQGRDIGQGLISTVKKMNASSVSDLIGKLDDWLHAEQEKENKKKMPSESRLIALQDRYDCIICFTEDANSVDGVVKKIEDVFSSGLVCPKCGCKPNSDKYDTCYKCKVEFVASEGIKLSTIHRAKGLEADRVFLLEPEGASVPHPMAKSAWQRKQEMNLRYVAITRAIKELVYVS